MDTEYRHWNVTRTVQLGATAEKVWEVIGGFYTIHEWHPDIERSEVPLGQTSERHLRRKLYFPGQDPTFEELISMDNENLCYRYRWHKGAWGEEVRNYCASLRVFAGDLRRTATVQWSSTFDHPKDAISEFYLKGFAELERRFPLSKAGQ